MKILYLGSAAPHYTSLARARALERLGHHVEIFDPEQLIPESRWWRAVHYRSGFRLLTGAVDAKVRDWCRGRRFDLVWVNGGRVVSAGLVRWLRSQFGRVINYNNDDPFGRRDGRSWDTYLDALPEYDLVCVLREVNVAEARQLGAREVLRVWMSYDPVDHAPVELTKAEAEHWRSEVVFVGTWMPERGPFLQRLIERGVPLTIFGHHWNKDPNWILLQHFHRSDETLGRNYVAAIQSAKIALGLLSKGNRDLHTRRSVEIPYTGTLLCAERTTEHLQMFEEGRDAIFWSTPEECASLCRRLLRDEVHRSRIATAGRERVLQLKLSNEDIAQTILDAAASGATNHSMALPRQLSQLETSVV